jgi:hypothetical protein
VSKKAEQKPDKKKKKDKKAGTGAPVGADGAIAPSVAGHPRARAAVRRAKGWGGLAGFALAAYLSMNAGVPAADAGMRALVAGVAGYMLAWACAVTVWRHLVLAELRAVVEGSRPGARTQQIAPVRAPAPAEEAPEPAQ